MDETILSIRDEGFQLRILIKNVLLQFNFIQRLNHLVNSSADFGHVLPFVLEFFYGSEEFLEVFGHVGLVLFTSPVTISCEEL